MYIILPISTILIIFLPLIATVHQDVIFGGEEREGEQQEDMTAGRFGRASSAHTVCLYTY